MEISVQITTAAIALPMAGAADPATGAVVEFTGIVRGEEAGGALQALVYEAYQPMAENEMIRLLREIALNHPCQRVSVIHRIGVVRVGETAIHLRVESAHRAEGFAMAAAFMDRLKQDVPIWKSEVIR